MDEVAPAGEGGAVGVGFYRDWIADLCFAYALSCGDVSLVVYDVITFYFEVEEEGGLRKVGFSTERRVDPQVVVGLLVDRQGFKFIVGSRQSKAPMDLESHFHWHGDAFDDGQYVDTITPKRGADIANDTALRAEPVWDRKLIRVHGERSGPTRPSGSPGTTAPSTPRKREPARSSTATRPPAPRSSSRMPVTGRSSTRRRWPERGGRPGSRATSPNLPAQVMDAAEVIGAYHDLWRVEASFRMSKTDLAARPMFHRTRDSIEAHLTIVFAALAVARTAQARTGLSIRRIVRNMRSLRSATIAVNGTEHTFPPQIPADLKPVVTALRG
ncbi:hypothetical protein SAMN05216377_1258 [Pseudonocardia oroxyli]|uniref:Transposase DDE domain-containing protein n=1 Tax=Pseudonocardia oroxyli TaxID=366584 RepID=A0A1G8D6T3_PSEOR|nr:hypothetical protein SAMN05216377_1258 [Pseudonocardia oroxyli]